MRRTLNKKVGVARREFMDVAARMGIASAWVGASGLAGEESSIPSRSAGWNMDITLYNRPGWTSHAWYHQIAGDGSVLVPIQSYNMAAPFGDFMRTITSDLVLRSADAGKSWTSYRDSALTAYPWGCYGLPGKTPTGELVSITCAPYTLSQQEREEHLERYGLERFYNSHSEWLYTAGPAAMGDLLREKEIFVHPPSAIGDHQVGFTLQGYVCRISSEWGKTWRVKPITGLPYFAKDCGSFRNTLITRVGAWVAAVSGIPNAERKPTLAVDEATRLEPYGSYALCSEDQGQTWKLNIIAFDPTGLRSFDQTALLELPSRRLLAMMRHTDWSDPQGPSHFLYQSYSVDGGRGWSAPVNSGLQGYPAHLLRLRSGKILCTYAYRSVPWGHRAALSADEGRTWDIDHVKILRDDSLPGWTTYPTSSQLEDGSIFTTMGMVKMAAALPQGRPFSDGVIRQFVYAAASLFSEEFVVAVGRS